VAVGFVPPVATHRYGKKVHTWRSTELLAGPELDGVTGPSANYTSLLNLAIVALIVLIYWDNARFHKSNPWYVLGFPFAVLLFIYIFWSSTIITLRNDGIRWRGTHYPLSELKANKV
jgi:hypothetical protein